MPQRPTSMNVYRTDYVEVAESIKSRLLRSSAASILVEITDGGNVRMIGCGYMPERTLAARLHGRRALGVYDKRAVRTIQRVRDRMRVLGAPMPGSTSHD